MKVFFVILGIVLLVIGTVIYFKKRFVNLIIGTIIFMGGVMLIGNGIASDSDEYTPSRSEYYEDTDDDNYSGEVSFRGRRVIVDYNFGRCLRRCGCTQYAHYPGQTACVYCEENDCSSNKFGHEH